MKPSHLVRHSLVLEELEAQAAQGAWVQGLARRLAADTHLAEDLVQEAWLQALQGGERARGPFSAWLAGVIRRVSWDRKRSDARRSRREAQGARPEGVAPASESAEQLEQQALLIQSVLSLDEPYRSAILMRYIEEQTPRAIAAELDVPVATVNSRLTRGLEQLRVVLLRAHGGDETRWLGSMLMLSKVSTKDGMALFGVALMKSKLTLVACLFLILTGVFLAQGSGLDGELPAADAEHSASLEPVAAAEAEKTQAPELPIESVASEKLSERAAVVEEEVDPSGPLSRVFGIVVDENGSPLAEVRAVLYTVGEPWIEGAEKHTYEAFSDAQGRFEFSTPFPTSSWVSLRLEPSRFHMLGGRDFGRAGGRYEDPLLEGDNDLGSFTLSSTGAIAGTLRCADGAVPKEARVGLGDVHPGGRSLWGMVEPSGRYVIEHVPPGTYNIETFSKGYLTGGLASIDVRAQEVSEGNDLSIEPAPSVVGRVLDGSGTPVEGVKLWGWPQSSGQGAGARTDAEGFFTVYLPQDEAYRFTAKKAGYRTFGEEGGGRGVTYLPGTTGIAIQLLAETQTTFLVVDANTGEPVERYGLSIGAKLQPGKSSSGTRADVPLSDHPAGEFMAPASPERHAFRLQAPGYAPRYGDVQHESAENPRQEIRLEPEGVLRGRVLAEGEPVARATVRVERCLFPKPGETRKRVRDPFGNTMTSDLDPYTGRPRILTCDANGAFELGELATGTYRIEISEDVGSPFVREDIAVTAGAATELGDLSLELGAIVHGRVLLDGGVASNGIEVYLDRLWQGDPVLVGPDGQFELRGVAPGDHTLQVPASDGLLGRTDPFPFHAKPGATLDLTLDLRPWQTGSVRLRILDAGVPRAHSRARMLNESLGVWGGDGPTNAAGELVMNCPREGVDALLALSKQGMYLGRTTDPVVITPGSEVLVLIEVQSGDLGVQFPASFEIPPRGEVRIKLASELLPNGWRKPVQLSTNPLALNAYTRAWEPGELSLGSVAAGDYEVLVEVWQNGNAAGTVAGAIHRQRFTASVQVRAGQSIVATLAKVE